jgi:hypothetical protein
MPLLYPLLRVGGFISQPTTQNKSLSEIGNGLTGNPLNVSALEDDLLHPGLKQLRTEGSKTNNLIENINFRTSLWSEFQLTFGESSVGKFLENFGLPTQKVPEKINGVQCYIANKFLYYRKGNQTRIYLKNIAKTYERVQKTSLENCILLFKKVLFSVRSDFR